MRLCRNLTKECKRGCITYVRLTGADSVQLEGNQRWQNHFHDTTTSFLILRNFARWISTVPASIMTLSGWLVMAGKWSWFPGSSSLRDALLNCCPVPHPATLGELAFMTVATPSVQVYMKQRYWKSNEWFRHFAVAGLQGFVSSQLC